MKEGKIELIADCEGVLKINTEKLNAVNNLGEMMNRIQTWKFSGETGDKIAGTRIIPLVIEEEKMQRPVKWQEKNRFSGFFRTRRKKRES